MKDNLKEFVALRDALVQEKKQLLTRLAQIESVLGQSSETASAPVRRGRPPGARKAGATPTPAPVESAAAPAPAAAPRPRGGKRIRNKVSLRDAIMAVTKNRPMTKQEILAAVQKNGYRFNAKDPMPSLNSVLYSKRQFVNQNGKFKPA